MRHRSLPRFLPMLLIALAAPVVTHATDGVVEINQACALAGSCFAGDAPLFPVTINGSPGQSYRLTSNLQVPDQNTTAILVTQVGVSIDLNGFSILGPVTCTFTQYATCAPAGIGYGVDASTSTRVGNGRIQGMGADGIRLSFDGVVEDVRVLNSGLAGITTGPGSTVRRSVASANGGPGISVALRGVVVESVTDNNGGEGIVLGQGSAVHDSVSSSNRLDGIRCTGNCLVMNNAATGNFRYGLAATPAPCSQTLAYGLNLIHTNVLGAVLNGACAIQVGANVCNFATCP